MLAAAADELGALLALMPDVDHGQNDRDLQTLLAVCQPFPGLWGPRQQKLQRYLVDMDLAVFARVRDTLRTSIRLLGA